MNVLLACEVSGAVRRAFSARGHNAWSCDLLPADDGAARHFGKDVRAVLRGGWDLMIAFPPCTYLTCSAEWAYGDGPYHQKVRPGTLVGAARRAARERALDFVRTLMDAPIPLIALENPIGCISTRIRKPDQIIQPWQFGEDASKATCLWLKGLPPLWPTDLIIREHYANQTASGQNRLSQSPERAKLRGITYRGIAEAMADQWAHAAPKTPPFAS